MLTFLRGPIGGPRRNASDRLLFRRGLKMFIRFAAMFGKFFLVLAHLLFEFLDDSIQGGQNIGSVVGGKEIVRLFGGYTEFHQGGFGMLQIDDHTNRGRSIKESRQALDFVADRLLNAVTQVTVLG